MSVPLISSVGFTEVNSAGTLNEKAGTTKSKLPVQFFRLTDNISGNLTMTDDSAHKKIILDTNGFNIINPDGSPITNNSSTTINLKGSGEVKSTLLTFTSSESSTSNTGTTTISAADNSTVVVTSATRDADISLTDGVSVSTGFGGVFSTSDTVMLPNTELLDLPPNPGSNNGTLQSSARAAAVQMLTLAGGDSSMSNLKDSNFRIVFGNGVTKTGSDASHVGNTITFSTTGHQVNFSFISSGGNFVRPTITGSVSSIRIPNNTVSGGGRTIAFTNNLAIACVLTGADPFDNVTVAAGATNTQTVLTTDGSFSLTGTISGSDGSSRPFALKDINDGTGSVDETEYTGTKSVSAF
jgi:hypothetical protein